MCNTDLLKTSIFPSLPINELESVKVKNEQLKEDLNAIESKAHRRFL